MNKQVLSLVSWFAVAVALFVAVYLWLGQAFTLPLALLSVIFMLAALFLQNESRR